MPFVHKDHVPGLSKKLSENSGRIHGESVFTASESRFILRSEMKL